MPICNAHGCHGQPDGKAAEDGGNAGDGNDGRGYYGHILTLVNGNMCQSAMYMAAMAMQGNMHGHQAIVMSMGMAPSKQLS